MNKVKLNFLGVVNNWVFKNKKKFLEICFCITFILLMIFAGDVIRVFAVVLLALFLFTTEKLPMHITAILIMTILMVSGLITAQEGVSGFSSPATITVLSMFILSAGVQKTGLLHFLGRYLFALAGKSAFRQILVVSFFVGPISGFINNTAVVAIMLPMILSLSQKTKTSATKLLIPLSYVSMAGGMLSLLGTSTSILANDILKLSDKIAPFGIFEFSFLGLIVLSVSIIYFLVIGVHLLPNRNNKEKSGKIEIESDFLVELQVLKKSALIGKTLEKSGFLKKWELTLIKIIRNKHSYVKDAKGKEIEEGDIIVVLADEQRIIEIDDDKKKNVKVLLNFDENFKNKSIAESGKIFKVLTKSRLFNERNINEIDFLERFNSAVVGVHRKEIDVKRLGKIDLEIGEILLVKANEKRLKEIMNSDDVLVIENVKKEFIKSKMWVSLAILIFVILIAGFNILPIMVSALVGIILMVVFGCVESEDVGNSVSWNIIFLLAGVIPLGIAMEKTGAALVIAELIATFGILLPPILVLGLFYLVTTLLTEIISNNAAVVLLVPIAISVAEKIGSEPRSFVLAVIFAASTSFLSPVGYQTNTMVYGIGNYKFSDFAKVGALLNFILLILTTYLISIFFGI